MEGSISPLCVRSSSTLCYFSNNVSLNSHRSLGFIFVILSGDELCIPANGKQTVVSFSDERRSPYADAYRGRKPGYEFDKASLLEYNHMSFGGPPVKTETSDEEDELVRHDENESKIEAEVLSAPPKLVYSKLVLRFAKKLLAAVGDKWDSHVVTSRKFPLRIGRYKLNTWNCYSGQLEHLKAGSHFVCVIVEYTSRKSTRVFDSSFSNV
ncbi:antitermination NusB domain-containing protein [Raphanus sativus]|nr:antitermination NusB domain-containing protein [Raphanus sativus]